MGGTLASVATDVTPGPVGFDVSTADLLSFGDTPAAQVEGRIVPTAWQEVRSPQPGVPAAPLGGDSDRRGRERAQRMVFTPAVGCSPAEAGGAGEGGGEKGNAHTRSWTREQRMNRAGAPGLCKAMEPREGFLLNQGY